jgi:hypothetical protein
MLEQIAMLDRVKEENGTQGIPATATETEEARARTTPLQELVSQIALHLADSWRVVPPHSDAESQAQFQTYLTRPSTIHSGDITLYFSTTWASKGRLYVSGHYRESLRDLGVVRYGDKAPSITVDPNRPPEKLAADITRRLLPEVVFLTKKVADIIDERARREVVLQDNEKGFTETLGTDYRFQVNRHKHSHSKRMYHFRRNDQCSGDVEMLAYPKGTKVRIKLELELDSGKEAAEFLNKLP